MSEIQLPAGYRGDMRFGLDAAREARRAQAPPGPVFHYAPAESFRGIIESGRLWLSNAAYLNDRNELAYPVDLAREVLRFEVLKGLLSEREPHPDTIAEQLVLMGVQDELHYHEALKPWYTGSFSLEGNQLSQWRAYCPNGGYAIGFEGKVLTEILERQFPLMFGAIEYEAGAQKQRIREIIAEHLSRLMELREKYSQVPQSLFFADFNWDLWFWLSHEFLFLKLPAFREEREWRLGLHAWKAEENVKFRTRNGTLVPYVEIDLSGENRLLPLDSIWIGPTGDQELAEHSARLLLNSKGYKEPHRLIKTSGYRLR